MTDEPAFLAAICATPDDDLPRLVYADWLDDNAGVVECPRCDVGPGMRRYPTHSGDWIEDECNECIGSGRVSDGRRERAEFIRVQCELAKIPDPPPEPSIGMRSASREQRLEALKEWKKKWVVTYYALRRRERELQDEHWAGWIRGAGLVPDGWKLSTDGDDYHVWRDEPYDDGFRFRFSRGFVEHVTATVEALFGAWEDCGCDRGYWRNGRRCPDCPDRAGWRRTEGVAAALWSSQPVRQFDVSDLGMTATIYPTSGAWNYFVKDRGGNTVRAVETFRAYADDPRVTAFVNLAKFFREVYCAT